MLDNGDYSFDCGGDGDGRTRDGGTHVEEVITGHLVE